MLRGFQPVSISIRSFGHCSHFWAFWKRQDQPAQLYIWPSPDEGEISLRGQILFSSSQGINLPPEQRRIGYMFQESLLFPHLKVRDNILYGYNLTSPSIRRIDPSQLVTLLELDPLMDRRPENISVGERQRVVLARALATSPNLLLLDEPLASLHMGIKGRILRYLKAVHRDLSIPMLYVSHSMSEVLAIADKATQPE